MKAKEAKITADKRAKELKAQREENERQRSAASAAKWKKEREDWLKDEIAWIDDKIAEKVKKGQTRVDVHLATFDKPEWAEEKAFRKGFAFEPELKKVIKHFKDEGYLIEFRVNKHENVDLSDLNPRDNWFTYETIMEVSWDLNW